jgi:hypothetical protein
MIWVRIVRYWLVVLSGITCIKLGISLRFASFPLLPSISWKSKPLPEKSLGCDQELVKSVDVVVSLYNFLKYKPVLEKSVKSCFANPKVTFHFILVAGSRDEVEWLTELVADSHHKLHLVDRRIGIYAAWNIGIESGTGDYITNLNTDDLRLPHSICCQAASLQQASAEGSFGNFILSKDILADLYSKSTKWLVSNLGKFDIRKLVIGSQNFMHCAPMWKRELHTANGLFNEELRSSGDTEFWLRCMASGASFVSYSPETVVYFHNPEGLSTSVGSVGHKEWTRIRDSFLKVRQTRVR